MGAPDVLKVEMDYGLYRNYTKFLAANYGSKTCLTVFGMNIDLDSYY